MELHNTLTGETENFQPRNDPVRIYVCGITPYKATHLGHAFVYVVFDTLIRFLRWQGHRVRYVQNITDVDNAILGQAKETGVSFRDLAEETTRGFLEDMDALGVLRPDAQPWATQEIPRMIENIRNLVAKGAAYAREGFVYFRVAGAPSYGRLSKLDQDEMLELGRERDEDPDDPRKGNPLDFVLWQPSAPGEPTWESPWGPGRPGWHIECSTMALSYLGEELDIHGGGRDLVFPHHEDEIAQSEAATGGRPFAHYWLHVGMVRLEGLKMSKSKGNLVYIHDLRRRFPAAVVRLALLGHHYRSDWDYDAQALTDAERLLSLIEHAMNASPGNASDDGRTSLDISPLTARFIRALESDLNTPEALDAMEEMAQRIVKNAAQGFGVRSAQRELFDTCQIFLPGLLRHSPIG